MGDDLNFAALNAGAAAIPQAVQAATDVYDSLSQNAKVADAMVKANPDLEARMGMKPGQFGTLSAQDKIASTTGYIKNQGAQEMLVKMQADQAQAQESRARAGYFQSFAADRTAQAQAQTQDDMAASNYAQSLDQQISNPDPNNPDAVAFAKSVPPGVRFQIHAAASAGRSNPRTAAALIRPLMNYFSGPGGQGGAPTTPDAIKDAEGNTIAQPAPNGKGGFTWVKTGTAAKYPPDAKVGIENGVIVVRGKDGGILDVHGAANPMNTMLDNGGAAPAPAAPAANPGAPTPQQSDITYLLANPSMAQSFDNKFGPGTSSLYLPKQ